MSSHRIVGSIGSTVISVLGEAVRGEIAWRTGIGATIFRVFAMPQREEDEADDRRGEDETDDTDEGD
jgi:hypothetical protein